VLNKLPVLQKKVLNIICTQLDKTVIYCSVLLVRLWSVVATADKGGGRYVSVCLSVCLCVCLLARLLKNACMDFDEMLRVDRCRVMDELINF